MPVYLVLSGVLPVAARAPRLRVASGDRGIPVTHPRNTRHRALLATEARRDGTLRRRQAGQTRQRSAADDK